MIVAILINNDNKNKNKNNTTRDASGPSASALLHPQAFHEAGGRQPNLAHNISHCTFYSSSFL